MQLLIVLVATVLTQTVHCSVCGVMNSAGSAARIVGGKEVTSYKYPWFASMHIVGNPHDHICGGVLITVRHVMTAAHCFQEDRGIPKKDYYDVTLGWYNHCKPSPTTRTFKVANVVVHEKFITSTQFDDIAIMTLAADNTHFMPICLPPQGEPIRRLSGALIMGFGITKYKALSKPCAMSEAQVDILDKGDCYKTDIETNELNDLMKTDKAFCAGILAGGVDTCQGDSGTSLIINRKGRYVTKGIVSFGYGCGDVNTPGVYTNVAYYVNWINNTIVNEQTPTLPTPVQPQRSSNIISNIIELLLG